MIRRVSLLALFALPAALAAQNPPNNGGPSVLKGHDSNAPVDVSADRIELQDRTDRAVFSGNVHATQGDMVMDSQRMQVAYAKAPAGGDPQIQRIDASGGVTVTSPGERARGSFGIYDLDRRLITLIGGVTLTRAGNTVSGARLVIDMNSGRSTIDGSAVGGAGGTTAKGGRVTGRFTVPQRTQNGAATAPPAR